MTKFSLIRYSITREISSIRFNSLALLVTYLNVAEKQKYTYKEINNPKKKLIEQIVIKNQNILREINCNFRTKISIKTKLKSNSKNKFLESIFLGAIFLERKLDGTIFDAEIYIEGYIIIRYDRNRRGRGVACYIKHVICFNTKNVFSNNIEDAFVNFFLPITKPIS